MAIDKMFSAGLAGNVLSKRITGTDEVCASRTAVATGSGAVLGGVAGGAIAVGAVALGTVSAPITVPLAVGSAAVAFVASLFD